MKLNINFLQTGGVPLTADLMSDIMAAIQMYDVVGSLAGHLTIISGCEITGNNVSSGVVAINNEVLFFEGGGIVPTVYVHNEEIPKTFEDQTDKVLIEKKIVKFGSGATSYNWADFFRLTTLKEIQTKVESLKIDIELLKLKTAPIVNGGIVWAWFKPVSEIPAGWKECIDIRGKTIVGVDPNDPDFSTLGATFGTKKHLLTVNEMPSHSHSINDPGHRHKFGAAIGWSGGNAATRHDQSKNFDTTTEKTGITINNNGGSQPHNNVQPSKIAYFIEPNFQ